MEFTVRKFDLLQELTLIQGVVERKTTIPILANVLVRAEGGELRIAATDLEIGLKSDCPSKVTVPGTITLPAKRLYEIVRALPDKDIKFKRGEANWVNVTCGSTRFRLLDDKRRGGCPLPWAVRPKSERAGPQEARPRVEPGGSS